MSEGPSYHIEYSGAVSLPIFWGCLSPSCVDLTMPSGVLLGNYSSVVLVLARPMGNGWKDLSVEGRTASKLVGRELPRWPPLLFQNLAKEALSSSLVAAACDQDIENIAVLVHCSPKIMALTADGDEHLVDAPDVAESTLSSPESASVLGSKLPAPGSNGFIGHR